MTQTAVRTPLRARDPRVIPRGAISIPLLLVGLTFVGCTSDTDAATSASARPGVDAPADRHETASLEALIAWNRTILEAAEVEDGFLTLKGLRSVTLFHLATRNALDDIATDPAWADADPVAALAGAGRTVASAEYPDLEADWQGLWIRSTAALDPGPGLERGAQLGASHARSWLEAREGDGWNAEAEYTWHPMAPGVYAEFHDHSATPEGFVFGAGWAEVIPFALESPAELLAPPPPEIASAEYAAAFEEVKRVGRFESTERSEDQSHLAMWWKEFVESSHNRLARELVAEEGLPLPRANRLFALLNVAIHDAYVSSFHNKYHYNHWRPYTAIRLAQHDGNPATDPDPGWDNLHRHTYAFPSYPSAHGTACAAAMTVFADTFGEARPFEMRIPEVDSAGPLSEKVTMDPAERSFSSFAEAAEECSASRVFLGIHFRYDSEAGTELGRQVGRAVLERLG